MPLYYFFFCDRFCPECRLKVLRAYSLLVGEVEPGEEKGYKPLLYLGLKCCPAEKHIHVQCNTDLISLLIARAEPELVGRFDLIYSKAMYFFLYVTFIFCFLVLDGSGMPKRWKLLKKKWSHV